MVYARHDSRLVFSHGKPIRGQTRCLDNESAHRKNHISDMESSWNCTRDRPAKSNGFNDNKFVLHPKESEFRFDDKDLTKGKFEKLIFRLTKKHLEDREKV
ncbi:MAG: hypothetical protein LBB24_00175 [Rickettsiales bacterium]|jgi:hypothetical protein|nr:hypothetical protein [Rickettsiales bacterium]